MCLRLELQMGFANQFINSTTPSWNLTINLHVALFCIFLRSPAPARAGQAAIPDSIYYAPSPTADGSGDLGWEFMPHSRWRDKIDKLGSDIVLCTTPISSCTQASNLRLTLINFHLELNPRFALSSS
jgi:hypothetical protein